MPAPRPDFMLGAATVLSQLTPETKPLMRAAGLRWLRFEIHSFDYAAFLRGESQGEAFHAFKQTLAGLRAEGFSFMGLTPLPNKLSVKPATSPRYFEEYRAACAFLAREFRGIIDWWQVANELDIWIFRDTLSLDQSVEFLKAGIAGLKETDPALKVGINLTLFPSRPGEVDGNTEAHEAIHIAKGIYQDPAVPVDHAGFDSYPGTWRPGGPESWHEYLDGFYALTGKPIIIQEFGYSAAGDLMTPEEAARGAYPCEVKKWRFAWRGAHTPEVQAEFVRESLRIFAEKPYVIGATYFRWKDSTRCWQCGQPDCPAETAWGLLDNRGTIRPSYYALKQTAAELFPLAST